MTPYRFIEFPKYVDGPAGPEIANSAEEERRIRERARCDRMQQARVIGRSRANAVQAARADAFATEIAPVIAAIRAEGIASLRGIAKVLNTRGVPSSRGGRWQASQVQRLLRRRKLALQPGAPPLSIPQNSVR